MLPTRRSLLFGLAVTPLLHACATPLRAFPGSAVDLWSQSGLDGFRREARQLGALAVVVATRGETIVSDGEVAMPLRIASIRKSLLSALYGIAVARRQVSLDATLADLGIDDDPPLTSVERRATVRQLLQARSGVYLPAAAETASMKAKRPARGSHEPGTHWYYNNWDFNALGVIYRQQTGANVFEGIEHELARPLGWRDFDPERHTRFEFERGASRFPAYKLMLSARDLANFGQLYLDRGVRDGQTIVPAGWIEESTRAHSRTGRVGVRSGYGYMWWRTTGLGGSNPAGLPVDSYSALGNGGRYLTVLPSQQTVVAIQPDERPNSPPVPLYARQDAYEGLLRKLLDAYRG